MARRKAREATADYLESVALWYLERYGGSVARVRAALERRVRRSVMELGTRPEDGATAIGTVLAKLTRMGLLDDARLAEARVRTLRARGKSARAITATLRRQGIAAEQVAEALARAAGDGHSELRAARTLVQKKRLGHRRPGEERDANRRRDLSRLARAGFDYATARRALDGDG